MPGRWSPKELDLLEKIMKENPIPSIPNDPTNPYWSKIAELMNQEARAREITPMGWIQPRMSTATGVRRAYESHLRPKPAPAPAPAHTKGKAKTAPEAGTDTATLAAASILSAMSVPLPVPDALAVSGASNKTSNQAQGSQGLILPRAT